MGKKVNNAEGPVKVIFNSKGFPTGQYLLKDYVHDAGAEHAPLKPLRENLRTDVKIILCDCHVTEREFKERATQVFVCALPQGCARTL